MSKEKGTKPSKGADILGSRPVVIKPATANSFSSKENNGLVFFSLQQPIKDNLSMRDFELLNPNGFVQSTDMVEIFIKEVMRIIIDGTAMPVIGKPGDTILNRIAISEGIMRLSRTFMVAGSIITKLIELRRDKWDITSEKNAVLQNYITEAVKALASAYAGRYGFVTSDIDKTINTDLLLSLLTLPVPEFNRASLAPFDADITQSPWSLLREYYNQIPITEGADVVVSLAAMRQMDYLSQLMTNYDMLHRLFPKGSAGTAVAANTAKRNAYEEIATLLLAIRDIPSMFSIFLERSVYSKTMKWIGIEPMLDPRVEANFQKYVLAYDAFDMQKDANAVVDYVQDGKGNNPLGAHFDAIPRELAQSANFFAAVKDALDKGATKMTSWRKNVFTDASIFIKDDVADMLLQRSIINHSAFSDYGQILDFQTSYSNRIQTGTAMILSVVAFDLYRVYGARIKDYNLKPMFELLSKGDFINRDAMVITPPAVNELQLRSDTSVVATTANMSSNSHFNGFQFIPSGGLGRTLTSMNLNPSALRAQLIRRELTLPETATGYYPDVLGFQGTGGSVLSPDGSSVRDIILNTAGITALTFRHMWTDARFKKKLATQLSSCMMLVDLNPASLNILAKGDDTLASLADMASSALARNIQSMNVIPYQPRTMEALLALKSLPPIMGHGRPYGLAYEDLIHLIGHNVTIIPALNLIAMPFMYLPSLNPGLGGIGRFEPFDYGDFKFRHWASNITDELSEHLAVNAVEPFTALSNADILNQITLAFNLGGAYNGVTLDQLRLAYYATGDLNQFRLVTGFSGWDTLIKGPACLHLAMYSPILHDTNPQLLVTHQEVYALNYIQGFISFTPILIEGPGHNYRSIMEVQDWPFAQGDPSTLMILPTSVDSISKDAGAEAEGEEAIAERIKQMIKARAEKEYELTEAEAKARLEKNPLDDVAKKFMEAIG